MRAPIEFAREFMRNPEKVGPCMPGVASIEPRSDTTYDVVVAAQVVVKSALFQMRAEITHEDATSPGRKGIRARMSPATPG